MRWEVPCDRMGVLFYEKGRGVMNEQLKSYQNEHMAEMLEILRIPGERLRRYGSSFTVALFYSEERLEEREARTMIRLSDSFERIEENLLFLVFDGTGIEGGIVAAEKLLSNMRRRSGQTIYTAVKEGIPGDSGTLLIHQLFNILEFAVEHGHRNEVLDWSYLNGVY